VSIVPFVLKGQLLLAILLLAIPFGAASLGSPQVICSLKCLFPYNFQIRLD
jgi:hypothetical protein